MFWSITTPMCWWLALFVGYNPTITRPSNSPRNDETYNIVRVWKHKTARHQPISYPVHIHKPHIGPTHHQVNSNSNIMPAVQLPNKRGGPLLVDSYLGSALSTASVSSSMGSSSMPRTITQSQSQGQSRGQSQGQAAMPIHYSKTALDTGYHRRKESWHDRASIVYQELLRRFTNTQSHLEAFIPTLCADLLEYPEEYQVNIASTSWPAVDVNIYMEGDYLIIEAQAIRKVHSWGGMEEEASQQVTKTFVIPPEADRARSVASIDEGFLTIILPKLPEYKQQELQRQQDEFRAVREEKNIGEILLHKYPSLKMFAIGDVVDNRNE